jgi:hypothetical protein
LHNLTEFANYLAGSAKIAPVLAGNLNSSFQGAPDGRYPEDGEMYLEEDIERIETALKARMQRGWLDGDAETMTIRPLGRWRRQYLVQFASDSGRQQWRVDANTNGVVLLPPGDDVTRGADRQDVMVSNIRRVLKSRLPSLVVRRELAKLRRCASVEGFDFPTLYQLAARQLSWMPEETANLLAEMAETHVTDTTARAA